jgi:hypothetical protein
VKTPPSRSLERLVVASATFDANEYTELLDESEPGIDPAVHQAILRQAALVVVFRQVKRRYREAATFETGQNVLNGYKTARYVLGTWDSEVSTSTSRTATANAKRLSDRMDYYPAIEVLMPSLSLGLRHFLTDLALLNVGGSTLETLFGLKKAGGIALTALVDGVYIGLAESDVLL